MSLSLLKRIAVFTLITCLILPISAECLELDPIAAADVAITENSQIISMDLLRLTEEVTSESIGRTKYNMERILRGELGKRKPLTVVIRGDGTYEIFDGNNTYTVLKELGAKNVPVEILKRPYQKGVKTIDELYAKNSEAEAEFNSLMKSLSEELGAKLVMRPGLKSRKRTIEKANELFNGDYSQIIDVLAASMIFNSEEEIYNAVEKLKAKNYFVNFNDHWREHPYPSGFRDYMTKLRLSNGIIAELQLNHAAIYEYSNNGDHLIYEFVRSNKNNPEMLKCVNQALDIQHEFFNAATDGRYSGLSKGVKNLIFELAKELSVQKTSEGAEPVLNRLLMIINHELKTPETEIFDDTQIIELAE